jgi:hypothetical protein
MTSADSPSYIVGIRFLSSTYLLRLMREKSVLLYIKLLRFYS